MKHLLYGLLLAVIGLPMPRALAQKKAPSYPRPIDPSTVTIIRDAYGVPHIYSPTDAGCAYGLAYATCEDDFQTLQFTLLAAKGRLAEVEGVEGAKFDYFGPLLNADKVVAEQWPKLSPEYRAMIEAYVQGVNDFGYAHKNELKLKDMLPLTTQELMRGYILMVAFISGVSNHAEKILKGTVDKFPIDFSQADAAPGADPNSPRYGLLQLPAAKPNQHLLMEPLHDVGGSNTFAFKASKTTDNQTTLIVNPHQPLEGPFGWYEAHLCSDEGLNITGALFPGGVCIFLGNNEHLGWSHTTNSPDITDIYRLQINPDNENQYMYDGQWRDFDVSYAKLKVKFGPLKLRVKRKVLRCVYGPVLESKGGNFYALRAPAFEELRVGEQWYRMNKATNIQEFEAALRMNALPIMNIMYADKDDNIQFISNGKVPVRRPGYDWKNVIPGNTSKTLWTNFYPLDSMPQLLNPPSGWLFNTNNTPFSCTETYCTIKPQTVNPLIGHDLRENNRSMRVMEIMYQYEGKPMTYEQIKALKYDLGYSENTKFWKSIQPFFEISPEEYPDLKPAIEKLQGFKQTKSAAVTDRNIATFWLAMWDLWQKLDLPESALAHGFEATKDQFVASLRVAQQHLLKTFKTVDIELGQLQRHTRGKVDLPIWGLPDNLASMFSLPDPKRKGYFRAFDGDGIVMFIRYANGKLASIESIMPYGASNRPNSRFYTSQMELFVNMGTKPMSLDRAVIESQATYTYHPGLFDYVKASELPKAPKGKKK